MTHDITHYFKSLPPSRINQGIGTYSPTRACCVGSHLAHILGAGSSYLKGADAWAALVGGNRAHAILLLRAAGAPHRPFGTGQWKAPPHEVFAKLHHIETLPALTGADLSGNDLRWADLTGADLFGANLRMTSLYRANLAGANLSGTNLYQAFLYGTNLSKANLYGANLTEANMSEANLYGANFEGAVGLSEKTKQILRNSQAPPIPMLPRPLLPLVPRQAEQTAHQYERRWFRQWACRTGPALAAPSSGPPYSAPVGGPSAHPLPECHRHHA